MEERKCVVVFDESCGRATGRILQGEEIVKELSFYLGRLQDSRPEFVEELIQKRYRDWARVNGVAEIRVEHTRP